MYYVVFGLLYLFSLLPMWVLYRLSDVIAFLLTHVIRYRRKVVLQNLEIAFPEKSLQERKKIARRFYRNFTDNFIEVIKLLSASRSFIQKRLIIDEPEVFEKLYQSGRKCQLHLGHNFNWEVANVAMPLLTSFPFLVVYMPIENKTFERLFLYLRTRTGSVMLPATKLRNAIVPYRNQQYLLALVADQVPGNLHSAYWMNFFNRPTPFIRGPERGAHTGNIPVVFASLYKTKRGFYRAHAELATENPAELPDGELTRRYRNFLEQVLRKDPAMWLWSHKRWKREWKEEYRDRWFDEKPLSI